MFVKFVDDFKLKGPQAHRRSAWECKIVLMNWKNSPQKEEIFQVWKCEILLSGKNRHCVGGTQALIKKDIQGNKVKMLPESVCTW